MCFVNSTPQRTRYCTPTLFSCTHFMAQEYTVPRLFYCASQKTVLASSPYTATATCSATRTTLSTNQDTVVKVTTTWSALRSAMSSMAEWQKNSPLAGYEPNLTFDRPFPGKYPPNTTSGRSSLYSRATSVESAPTITVSRSHSWERRSECLASPLHTQEQKGETT